MRRVALERPARRRRSLRARARPGASTPHSSPVAPQLVRPPVWRIDEDEIVCLFAFRVPLRSALAASSRAELAPARRPARAPRCSPRSAAIAARSRSTNTACRAPRESASMPSAPVPANRSSTRVLSMSPSIENSASRTRSEVGRVVLPRGAFSRRPPSGPRSPASTHRNAPLAAAGVTRACDLRQRRRRNVPGLRRDRLRAPRRRTLAPAHRRAARARARAAAGRRPRSPRRARGRARAAARPRAGRRPGSWPIPDWRVPISSPSLRSAQVDLGQAKPSACSRQRAQPRRRPGGPIEQAQLERCSPRPTRPRSWCSCEMPEALGVLDQHHGRVRHVDPDLDHGRRDQHVRLAGGERRHRLLLLARPHPAVQQHQLIVAQLALAQPLQLRRRGAQVRLPRRRGGRSGWSASLGLLDQRTHDVRLPARAQLLAQLLVRARALGLAGDHARVDRLAPRGSSRSIVVSRSP